MSISINVNVFYSSTMYRCPYVIQFVSEVWNITYTVYLVYQIDEKSHVNICEYIVEFYNQRNGFCSIKPYSKGNRKICVLFLISIFIYAGMTKFSQRS